MHSLFRVRTNMLEYAIALGSVLNVAPTCQTIDFFVASFPFPLPPILNTIIIIYNLHGSFSCTETAVSFIYLPKPPLLTVEHPQYLQRLEVLSTNIHFYLDNIEPEHNDVHFVNLN